MKRVLTVVMLGLETTSYLVILSCTRECGGERCEERAGQWHEATRGLENSQINSLILVFLKVFVCLDSGIFLGV